LIEKKDYSGNFESEGLTIYVYYEKNGSYHKAGSAYGMVGGSEGMCEIYLALNPNARPNSDGKMKCDARFHLGNPKKTGVDFYEARYERNLAPISLDNERRSYWPVFQFDGKTIKKISQ